jgi:ribosomal 50S subunit-recycling heat shock protein
LRLDLFLAKSQLLKSRSAAKQACEEGRVSVGERPSRASREVSEGDVISLDFFSRSVKVQIVRLPWKNMRKSEATSTYQIISEQSSPRSSI